MVTASLHKFPLFPIKVDIGPSTLFCQGFTWTIICIFSVLGDLTFDGFAYSMGALSVLAQGLYLTLVQQSAENQLSTLEILQLNSYNTLGPFIVMSVLVGEPEDIVKSKYIGGNISCVCLAVLQNLWECLHVEYIPPSDNFSGAYWLKSGLYVLVTLFYFNFSFHLCCFYLYASSFLFSQ